MSNQKHLLVIDDTIDSKEAYGYIFRLITEKINFHIRQRQYIERNRPPQTAYSEQFLTELRLERQEILDFLQSASLAGRKLTITSKVEIKFAEQDALT